MIKWRTTHKISARMSKIKSRGSLIEKSFEGLLKRNRLRYRRHFDVIGKPDFVLLNSKTAIFCDSHFWHGHDWKTRKKDHKSNVSQWRKKIESNMKRDKKVNATLRKAGWKVFRFWEHEILENPNKCLGKIQTYLEAH